MRHFITNTNNVKYARPVSRRIRRGQKIYFYYKIGPVKVNTIVLNWFEQLSEGFLGIREQRYGLYLKTAFRLGCNLIVLDSKEEEWDVLESMPAQERRIDVWWWGDASSRLMLLLAYLMTRSKQWGEAKIRMRAVAHEDDTEKTSGFPCKDNTGMPILPGRIDDVVDCLKRMLDEDNAG